MDSDLNIVNMTLKQLKEELRGRNENIKGNKATLQNRLTQLLKKDENDNTKQMSDSSYVTSADFMTLLTDYEDFKRFVFEKVNNTPTDNVLANEKEELLILVQSLKKEIENKNTIIALLKNDVVSLKKELDSKKSEEGWHQVPKRSRRAVAPSPPQTVTPRPPRNARHTIPGNSSYAQMTSRGKKCVIYGDSLVKRVRGREMAGFLKNGQCYVKAFPGSTASELCHHVEPSLKSQPPDTVIIHAGTNDIRTGKTADQIAKNIVEIGQKCKQNGTNDIFISSLIQRRSFHDTKKVREVNDFLKELCTDNNFIYISNDFLTKDFLWDDGVHFDEKTR